MRRTTRGFAVYADIKDCDGARVRVQRSSAIGQRRVWIFPEVQRHHVTGEIVCGANLNVPKAKRIIKALQSFIESKD